jgi:hypothetical protein
LGVSNPSLAGRLRRADINFAAGELLTARQIYTAMTSAKEAAQAREAAARAEKIERENRIEDGGIMERATVDRYLREILGPVSQRFDSLASECCALCNPTDPAFARTALESWAAQARVLIREGAKRK